MQAQHQDEYEQHIKIINTSNCKNPLNSVASRYKNSSEVVYPPDDHHKSLMNIYPTHNEYKNNTPPEHFQ